MKKICLICLCFVAIVSYGLELRQADQAGIDLIFGYEFGKPDGKIFYSPKHSMMFVPYTSKSEDGKRYFSIWMLHNDKFRFENMIGQISTRELNDPKICLSLNSNYDKRIINDYKKGKESTVNAFVFHNRHAMIANMHLPGEWKNQRWEMIRNENSQWISVQSKNRGKHQKTMLSPLKSTNTKLFKKMSLPKSFVPAEFLKINFNSAPFGVPQKYGNGYWIRYENDRVLYYFDDPDFAWCIGFVKNRIVMTVRGNQQGITADFHADKKFGKIFYQQEPFQFYLTRSEENSKHGLEIKLNPYDSKHLFSVSACALPE